MRLLAREPVYWVDMNADIEKTRNQCAKCLEYQQTQPHDKAIPHEVPCKPWEVVGTDIFFFVKNKKLLCIVYYYSNFPIAKKSHRLTADDMFGAANIVFTEFRLPKKIISDAGTNFTSETFRQFCRR